MENKYPEVELLKDIFDMQDMTSASYNQLRIFFKEVKIKDTLANFVWQLLDELHFVIIASLYGLVDRIPKNIQTVANMNHQTIEEIETLRNESLDILKQVQNKDLLKQNVLMECSDLFPILCPDCNRNTLLMTGKIIANATSEGQELPKVEKTVIEFSFQQDSRLCSQSFDSLRYCPYCKKIVSDTDFYEKTQSIATICSKYFQ